jgi:hypothetical protein
MGLSDYGNLDKNKVLLQLLQDNQFIMEALLKRISIIEAKNNLKQNCLDDELLKELMSSYYQRRALLTKLIYCD